MINIIWYKFFYLFPIVFWYVQFKIPFSGDSDYFIFPLVFNEKEFWQVFERSLVSLIICASLGLFLGT